MYFWETRVRGDAFIDSCDLHACLVVLRQAMRVRPEGVLSFRSCSHCSTVFDMSLIILITIRMCRPVLIKKRSTIHLQTVLTLTHRLQTMSVDFVAIYVQPSTVSSQSTDHLPISLRSDAYQRDESMYHSPLWSWVTRTHESE